MRTLAHDVRYGIRLLAKQPGFSIVAVLTIALGICVSVALFSVIDAALLHPLPYSHPEELVTVLVAAQDPAGRYSKTAVWQPEGASHLSRRGSGTPVIARLRPGVTREQAVSRLAALTPPNGRGTARVELQSMYDDETGGYTAALSPLAWGV